MNFVEAKKLLDSNNHFVAGKIFKPHSNKGQLAVQLFIDLKIYKKESVFVDIDGYPVPFSIDYQMCNFDAVMPLIKFNFIDTIDQAKKLSGRKIICSFSNEIEIIQCLTDWENFVTGFNFYDAKNKLKGKILSFIDDSQNPIFEFDINGKQILLPLNSVTDFDTDFYRRTVFGTIPETILKFYQ